MDLRIDELDTVEDYIAVYAIYSMQNPQRAYFGSSKQVGRRLRSHAKKLQNGTHANWKLRRIFKTQETAIRFKVLHPFKTIDQARRYEQKLINTYGVDNTLNVDPEVKRHRHD